MSVQRLVAWAYAGQLTSVAVSFAGAVLLARLLTPFEMGVYALAAAISGVVSLIASSGLGNYIIREVDPDNATLETAFTLNAILNAIISGGLLMIAHFRLWLGLDAGVASVLEILALVPLFATFEFRPAAMLQRTLQFKRIAYVQTASVAANVGFTVVLAIAGFSYYSIAYGLVAGAAISAILMSLAGPQFVSLRPNLSRSRRIIIFGAQILSISGLATLIARLCEAILGWTLGLAALGLYTRATTIASLLFNNIYGTATRVAFAKFSEDARTTSSIEESFMSAMENILAIMWPLFAGVGILAAPLVRLLFGDRWIEASGPLSFLMLAYWIALLFGMNWEVFVIRKETAKQVRIEVVRAVCAVVLFAIGSTFSLRGAALGRVGDCVVGAILYLPSMTRLIGTSGRRLFGVYRRAFVLTLLAAGPSLLLMISWSWSPAVPIPSLVLAVLAGIILWILGLLGQKHPLLAHGRLLIFG